MPIMHNRMIYYMRAADMALQKYSSKYREILIISSSTTTRRPP